MGRPADATGDGSTSPSPARERRRHLRRARQLRGLIVVAGLAATQFVLYGPSLVGRQLLLPLDILTEARVYLPSDPAAPDWRPPQTDLPSDVVLTLELQRTLAASQVRAGRLPLWNPYSYAGAPLLAANQASVFSPFSLLSYAHPGPEVVAWIQLCKALVGGIGALLFFRRVLRVGYWPATFGAWCYPLTGFLVFWTGYPLSQVALWLPWLLLATDAAVRRPGGRGGPGLALVTAAILCAGHPALAAALLVICGLYFLWALVDRHGLRGLRSLPALRSALAVVAGGALGGILALPQTLPAVEYLQYSWRAAERARGQVDFTPVGAVALPMLVLPDFYGTMASDSFWVVPSRHPGNRFESAAGAYAGLLAALVLLPLAARSRRHRSIALFLVAIGFFGVAQPLRVPLLAVVFHLPPLSLMQNNRWVFATSFAILSLAVIGLHGLRRRELRLRGWLWPVPVVALVGLGAWCLERARALPAPWDERTALFRRALAAGQVVRPQMLQWLHALDYRWLEICLSGAVLCGVGLVLWACLAGRWLPRRHRVAVCGALMVAEMVWFAYGVQPQTDPALYYPRIPALMQLRQRMGLDPGGPAPSPASPSGRILGVDTFPAALSISHALRDLRGYDAIDPIQLVELLSLCRDPGNQPFPYAALQAYVPAHSDRIERLSPIVHLLGVRYLLYWGPPPEGVEPLIVAPPYSIVENRGALPRVFVPRRVEVVPDKAERLALLGSPGFDPREVAYVETPLVGELVLPADAAGGGQIVADGFERVEVRLEMQTPGLVVLADLWYPGWKAYLDGTEVPVQRTNHALRGVVAPAGRSTLVFSYEPASVAWGLRLGLAGAALLGAWALRGLRRSAARAASGPRRAAAIGAP